MAASTRRCVCDAGVDGLLRCDRWRARLGRRLAARGHGVDHRLGGGTHLVARGVHDVELRYLRRLFARDAAADRLEVADGVVKVAPTA
jgi:hypothetical protein